MRNHCLSFYLTAYTASMLTGGDLRSSEQALHTGQLSMCFMKAARAPGGAIARAATSSNRLPSSQSDTLISYFLLGRAQNITVLFVCHSFRQ
jgi:hypothetical protein